MNTLPRELEELRVRVDEAMKALANGVKKSGGRMTMRQGSALEHLTRARHALGLARADLLDRSTEIIK